MKLETINVCSLATRHLLDSMVAAAVNRSSATVADGGQFYKHVQVTTSI